MNQNKLIPTLSFVFLFLLFGFFQNCAETLDLPEQGGLSSSSLGPESSGFRVEFFSRNKVASEGETIAVEIRVRGNQGGLNYSWYFKNRLLSELGPRLILGPLSQQDHNARVSVKVKDLKTQEVLERSLTLTVLSAPSSPVGVGELNFSFNNQGLDTSSQVILDFGKVVGNEKTLEVLVKNQSLSGVFSFQTSLEKREAFQVTHDCGMSLSPGSSCSLLITYKAALTDAFERETLSVSYDNKKVVFQLQAQTVSVFEQMPGSISVALKSSIALTEETCATGKTDDKSTSRVSVTDFVTSDPNVKKPDAIEVFRRWRGHHTPGGAVAVGLSCESGWYIKKQSCVYENYRYVYSGDPVTSGYSWSPLQSGFYNISVSSFYGGSDIMAFCSGGDRRGTQRVTLTCCKLPQAR